MLIAISDFSFFFSLVSWGGGISESRDYVRSNSVPGDEKCQKDLKIFYGAIFLGKILLGKGHLP